jgi:hypothetical protein
MDPGRLDALLAAERDVAPSAALRARITAAAPRAGTGRWRRLGALARGLGLAGALVAGGAAGVAVAGRQTVLAPAAGGADPAYEAARDLGEPADAGLAP